MQDAEYKKYEEIIKHPNFRHYFSVSEKQAVQRMCDAKNPISDEELLKQLKQFHYSPDIVDFIINKKKISAEMFTRFAFHTWCTQDIINSAIKREDLDDLVMKELYVKCNKDILFNKIYNVEPRQPEVSQTFLMYMAKKIMNLEFADIPKEYVCVFAHIKNEEYVKSILENTTFLESLDVDTYERLIASIADNIYISDNVRQKAFNMDCDYDRVKNKTYEMKKAIYSRLVETYIDMEYKPSDYENKQAKNAAYKRLTLLVENKELTNAQQLDLFHRLLCTPYNAINSEKMRRLLFKHSTNPDILTFDNATNAIEREAIMNNPNTSDREWLRFAKVEIDDIPAYVKRHGKITERQEKILTKTLSKKGFGEQEFKKLLDTNEPTIYKIFATSYNSPRSVTKKLENCGEWNTEALVTLTKTANMLHIPSAIKDKLVELYTTTMFSAHDYTKDKELSYYNGPTIIADKEMLNRYKQVFNEIIKNGKSIAPNIAKDCVVALEKKYQECQRDKKFNIKENTKSHLMQMRINIKKHLVDEPDLIQVYKKIDKALEICNRIDAEIRIRETFEHNRNGGER